MELYAASITDKEKSSLVRFLNSFSAELDCTVKDLIRPKAIRSSGTASDEYVRKELRVLIFYLSITLITFQSIGVLLSDIY